jgi:hypothetical protein
MPKVTAFVARSFDPSDAGRVEPITSFLASFQSAGFICQTAEPPKVELVHTKVRELIDASDVFIGIFTRRSPICERARGLKAAFWVGICFSAAWAKYPRRARTVNSPALTLTKWDYFLAALAAIRARKFFSC